MSQPEFSFDASEPPRGYERWQAERRAAKVALGKRLGLPLGHAVELWLRGNVRLRGRLELAEEKLFLPEGNDAHLHLTVGRTVFEAGEIESCVRMD
jgi:hypothetical protein